MNKERVLLVVVFVALRSQQDAVVVLDAGEGCGGDEASLDEVVLQVDGDQRRVVSGVRVTQGVHRNVAVYVGRKEQTLFKKEKYGFKTSSNSPWRVYLPLQPKSTMGSY